MYVVVGLTVGGCVHLESMMAGVVLAGNVRPPSAHLPSSLTDALEFGSFRLPKLELFPLTSERDGPECVHVPRLSFLLSCCSCVGVDTCSCISFCMEKQKTDKASDAKERVASFVRLLILKN